VKDLKAVSPLIAIIVLIAITISGGLLVFAFTTQTLTSGSKRAMVNVESVSLCLSTSEPEAVFAITIKNIGNVPIKLLIVRLHNESDYTVPSVTSSNPLEPGRTVGVLLTPPTIHAERYIVGNAYSVTIRGESSDGSILSTMTSVKCLGTSKLPVVGPPPFERVASLQTPDFVLALAVDGNYLYAGLYADPSVILKIDLSTFTLVGSLELNAKNGEKWILGMVASGGYLYVGFEPSPVIAKVDLSTFSEVDSLTLKADEYDIWALAVSDGFLYAGIFQSPSKIVKVDLATFSRVGALDLPSGEDYVSSLAVSGNCLYAGLDTEPIGKIAKISLSTFTEVSCLTFDTGEQDTMGMVVSGGYLYAALDSIPAKVVKVDLSTFEKEATLTLNSDEQEAYGVAVSGNYLYVAIASAGPGNPLGEVVRIDMSTFTRVASVALSGIVPWTPNGIIASGSYLYVVSYSDVPVLRAIDKIKIASVP
jgi:hypothetical protein